MSKFCSNCGNELGTDTNFCSKCGAKINNDFGNNHTSLNNDYSRIPERNIVTCVILSIITCGIYGIYWFICMQPIKTNSTAISKLPKIKVTAYWR